VHYLNLQELGFLRCHKVHAAHMASKWCSVPGMGVPGFAGN